MFFSNHVYCTSVKCAAAVSTLTPLIGVCREINQQGREDGRFFFDPETKQGEQTEDIISAFSILTRGGINPQMNRPNAEVCKMVNEGTHAIHVCHKALTERDRLHNVYRKSMVEAVRLASEENFAHNSTPLAACLSALGHSEIGHAFDGKSCFFLFEKSDEIKVLIEAFYAAWNELLLPFGHPLYWMKSCLQKREEILKLYNASIPYYAEKSGGEQSMKVVMTPVNVTPDQMEKAKKYL